MVAVPNSDQPPSASVPDDVKSKPEEGVLESTASSGYVGLLPGTALIASECDTITNRDRTTVVVFAGNVASGKTTLLTSIYEEFLQGPFGGFAFAGSKTLVGYERVCHLNRFASGLSTAETERTKGSDEAYYYHLSLKQHSTQCDKLQKQVIFAVPSGELYELACDSADDCRALVFLRRADVLAILINGEKLSNADTRAYELDSAIQMLRSFLDANMIGTSTRVEYLISKYDCIRRGGQDAEDFANMTKKRLNVAFSSLLPTLKVREVAARPVGEDLPLAYGVEEAFIDWLAVPSAITITESESVVSRVQNAREIARFR
ncbi:MAG TPA: hypothetical protein VGL38_08030 [bacterium]|jgi:hypothetical protein